jgi:hypothetical protein
LGLKREEVTWDNLPSSPNIIWVFVSCRLIWANNVARIEKERNLGHLEDLGVDGKQTRREDVHWIDLGQDKDTWRAVVSTAMNLGVA